MKPGAIHKNTRRSMELVYLQAALHYVETQIQSLTPGINTNHKNYMDLVAEKDELTQRITRAKLELKGSTCDEKPVRNMPYGNILFLPSGGTRRFG